MHPVSDLRFAARLRELRAAAGLSLAALSQQAYVAKSTLSMLESGQRRPSPEMARALDEALGAGGELAGLVDDQDGAERVAHAIAHPGRLDARTVEAFAQALAAQRRLDDVLAASVMLPMVTPQWETVHQLARAARGPHADRLRLVAAEWTQFQGWLTAECRQDGAAARLLEQARQEAAELEDGVLVAQALDFRGWPHRQRSEHRGAARAYAAVASTPGVSAPQRVNAMTHAAHALARAGEAREAARLLGEARDLVDAVTDPPETAYWLSPAFARLGIGLALAGAGDQRGAAEQLREGLAGLPDGWGQAEWAQEYREALTLCEQ